jgi:hypothetical protein
LKDRIVYIEFASSVDQLEHPLLALVSVDFDFGLDILIIHTWPNSESAPSAKMVDAMEGVVTEKQQPDPTASAVAGTEPFSPLVDVTYQLTNVSYPREFRAPRESCGSV